ncbi:MAG TPA: nucleoside triphosphate pyrophosphohydrolase [Candidatus Binataceae bacterium]|jgi:MazG family protein|nr:nucleoside triphosphate pyrophosphohydrolase [Candidatus Binataceae bacterium]
MSNDSSQNPGREFTRLLTVLRELRQRCPWDQEQTVASLGKHLVEEAYEALDAIERDDDHAIIDELGDLLAQVFAVAVIAEERQRFRIAELFQWAADKLVRRHPHVYGDIGAATSAEVIDNWNRIKQAERTTGGATSALDGIARAMPALARAEKLGSRARQAGMDWHDIHDVLAKVREEMDEVEGALANNDVDAAAGELGDMLLALANAPRFIDHNAEETLRRACDKFALRFKMVEQMAASRGLDLKRMSPEEIDALWKEAKRG